MHRPSTDSNNTLHDDRKRRKLNKFIYRRCQPCSICLHPTLLHLQPTRQWHVMNSCLSMDAALFASANAHRAVLLLIDFPNRLNIKFYFIEMWPTTSPSGVSYPTLHEPYRFLIVPFVLGTDFIPVFVSAACRHADSDIPAERHSESRTSSMPFRGSHL